MSTTDSYEFEKSLREQTMDAETPYSRKNFNFINDINNGSYSVGGSTLVQFDGSSIFNTGHFIDPASMYLTVPIVRVVAFVTSAGAIVAPAAQSITRGNEWVCSLKAGFWNLIQSYEIAIDGRTVVQQTPNTNFYNNFKMLSNMSQDDIESYGSSLGIGAIDNERSIKFSGLASTTCAGGNGVKNNNMFSVVDTTGVVGTTLPNQHQPLPSVFGTQSANTALYVRNIPSASSAIFAASAGGDSNIYGTASNLSLMSVQNMSNEFKSNFQIRNNYMVWIDTAVIRLKDLSNFFDKLPLMQNMNMLLRLYLNTGVVGCTYKTGSGAITFLQGSNTTFTSTCPLIITNLAASAPATTAQIVAGLFIGRATTTSMLGVNLGASEATHPMTSCRLYYGMVQIKPTLLPRYIESSRAKRVLYKHVLYNNIANIDANTNISQLLQSGVTRISGVLLIPWVSASTHGLVTAVDGSGVTTAFSEPISPFDTAPLTSCLSLTSLNVAIGGVNELMNFNQYTYENFLQQVSLYDKVNASDLGLSCGLLNQSRWELAYRYYWIDCSRYSDSIANVPRNVTVTFVNNTLQRIDVAAFVEFISEVTVDCLTGRFA